MNSECTGRWERCGSATAIFAVVRTAVRFRRTAVSRSIVGKWSARKRPSPSTSLHPVPGRPAARFAALRSIPGSSGILKMFVSASVRYPGKRKPRSSLMFGCDRAPPGIISPTNCPSSSAAPTDGRILRVVQGGSGHWFVHPPLPFSKLAIPSGMSAQTTLERIQACSAGFTASGSSSTPALM